ncbi:hypothetical protein R2R35_13640 [Anaerocolumna sp. AGMB13020]|uniref:hypothetical protein n=1 Tax=Anaerocolumna sp. AGMB13020 TaxID=3081750 RepID=UPI002952F0E8|nr:hypothetical protein [Anaerocolumna sp. AGMB13020]WOO34842.1 hypothetical protein R2R35_13640 [Anaerocolumna sp. AGMB13020]
MKRSKLLSSLTVAAFVLLFLATAYQPLLAKDKDNLLVGEGTAGKEPIVKVDVDLTAEKEEQISVDAGHSPWKLDPAFVAQVFASLLLSPEGITGEYPIPYEEIEITANNGTDATAEIKSVNSIAKYVYLKRLVRQDDTGIWTVVGYDPVN